MEWAEAKDWVAAGQADLERAEAKGWEAAGQAAGAFSTEEGTAERADEAAAAREGLG